MAEFEEKRVDGVFGGVTTENNTTTEEVNTTFSKVESGKLPTKPSVWSKIRSFLFQEIDWKAPIKIELTPYQQKIEDEINEFLHQEISIKGFWNLIKS